jgi:hypothetical protein
VPYQHTLYKVFIIKSQVIRIINKKEFQLIKIKLLIMY